LSLWHLCTCGGCLSSYLLNDLFLLLDQLFLLLFVFNGCLYTTLGLMEWSYLVQIIL